MDIDRSKENIQPLRGGRNQHQLGQALQAQLNPDANLQLHRQRSEHEAAINSYDGADPLDPWFNYIQWIEQSYPKHGHEGQINKIIKDCLAKFENDDRYTQDRRFIKLWIKHIDDYNNPLEMYQLLYNRGIGVQCSEFYRAWAFYCEEASDYNGAEQIFNTGLQKNAQPRDELEQAHMAFQICFAQRMLHNDSPTKRKAASALAETRMALTSLRTVKRRNTATVPAQRIGDNIKHVTPGVVKQNADTVNQQTRSNVMINIYNENPGPSSFPTAFETQTEQSAVAPLPSLLKSCNSVENQKEIGMWTNSTLKTDKACVKMPTTPLPFALYEDEGIILSNNHVPECLEDLSTFSVPVSVPDPPDPNKVPMYNKKEVYKDGDDTTYEYSLEEIKARKYKLSKATKCESVEKESNKNNEYAEFKVQKDENDLHFHIDCQSSIPSTSYPLENANNDNPTESKMISKHSPDMLDEGSSPTQSEFNLEKVIAQSNSLLNADDQNLVTGLETNNENFNCIGKHPYDEQVKDDSTEIVVKIPSNYDAVSNNAYVTSDIKKNYIIDDFNRSLMSNLLDGSMTVNTKEAMQELNLFGASDSISVPIIQVQPQEFDIHEDHSMTMAAVKAKFSNIDNVCNKKDDEAFENVPDRYVCTNNFTEPQQLVDFDLNLSSTQSFCPSTQSTSTPCNTYFKNPQFTEPMKNPVKNFNLSEYNNPPNKQICYKRIDNRSKSDTNNTGAETNTGRVEELYPIMETTREYRSGSSSSESNITTRNAAFGYTGRESSGLPLSSISEKIQDSKMHQESNYRNYVDPNNVYMKKSANTCSTNMDIAVPNHNYALSNENIQHPSTPVVNHTISQVTPQYHTLDHQYHKSPVENNGYNPQRNMLHCYQNSNQQSIRVTNNYQNMNCQIAQPNSNLNNQNYMTNFNQNTQSVYPNSGYQSPQQGVQNSSSHNGFQSPSHVPQGFQSPQQNMLQHGFQSPQQGYTSPQQGYTSPQQGFASPPQGFTSPRNGYVSPQQGYVSPQFNYPHSQHVYHNHSNYQQSPNANVSGYQNPGQMPQGYLDSSHSFNTSSHNYMNVPNVVGHSSQQYPQQVYVNQNSSNQSYQHQQNYSDINQSHNYHNNQSYTVQNGNQLRRSQHVYSNYHNNQLNNTNYAGYSKSSVDMAGIQSQNQYTNNIDYHQECSENPQSVLHQQLQLNNSPAAVNTLQKQATMNNLVQHSLQNADAQRRTYQSSTSKLRSIRHEVPHLVTKPNSCNIENSTLMAQFNYTTAYNEPKDNANTPKFTNSPNISQKMHKNLYVSSPEQAQIPPNNSEISKEVTLQTSLSNQSYKNVNNIANEKYKDVSKRQLDFEFQPELQSEDSRDSVRSYKGSRTSSKHSRQSVKYSYSESLQMDVDSENSTDCSISFRSNYTNSLISTQDISLPAAIDFPKIIDPFNNELCNSLLQYVKFPNKNHISNYVELRTMPKLQQGAVLQFDQSKYSVDKQLGKGTFGFVFKGYDICNQEPIALKYQKPGNPWEFYICQELKARINEPFMLPGYMDIRSGYFGGHASIFISELAVYGSLLDVANRIKQATTKCISEYIVMLMASEMLSIIHHLHKAQIIHADIKPDNFLVMKIPQTESRIPSLQLIDFGCAIDMSLFPKDTTFKKVISTDGFTCTEMRGGRPWTYQTDLYCLAGTVYVILMGNYMQTTNRSGQWVVEKKWPRYMKQHVWDKIFTTLLNVKDCFNIPDLLELKEVLDDFLRTEDSNLSSQLRTFEHVLKCK